VAGGLIVKFGFAAALGAAFLYAWAHARADRRAVLYGRLSFFASVAAQATASALLLFFILTHQFQYTYIWSYSSTNLPIPLLISTFYAGQEGSFMLWTLFTALIGLFLARYASRKDYEAEVMAVYSLILAFLFLMLVVKDPFEYIWVTFASDVIQSGPVPQGLANILVLDAAKGLWAQIPAEGRGLNPLLQNYWMVIHPQILFMGFSAMAIPYTLAVAGLLKKDYHSWIRVATPWSVFAALVLGVGIILGGYWAYETLGWGGFWGWDPVENSSLIPWLICVASIHTSLTQRRNGAFVRTNFALSLLSFVMVLYSTFLTRSGILGDTSVHSFVDPGMWVYWLLLLFIAVFVALGFGLLLWRMREMPKVPVQHSVLSREFALFLGAGALVFSAVFITVGTSSPIITTLLNGKASAVDIMYYVHTNLPLGIAITFLSGVGQLLWWRRTKTASLLKRMLVPAVVAFGVTAFMLLLGTEELLILLFVFTAAFSLAANVQVGWDMYRGNPKLAGGALAHIGIAVMCIGFVTSERYDETRTVALEKGKPAETLGYQLTYTGHRQVDAERYAFDVRVERDGRVLQVAPVMHYSEFTQSILRHPDLVNFLHRDFYVAPLSVEEATSGGSRAFELLKGTPTPLDGLSVTFLGFDFTDADRDAMMENKPFEIRALLEVVEGAKRERVVMRMNGGAGAPEYIPGRFESSSGDYAFTIVQMKPNQEDDSMSALVVSVTAPTDASRAGKDETLVIEASIKPYINLVWVGTVTLAIGFLLTMYRRLTERETSESEEEETEA
jgi:cytochrome c-type biogenesis protein CcmF